MNDLNQRQDEANAKMGAGIHATYARMDRGELAYEDDITELGRIADEHLAATKAIWDERRGGAQ